MINREKFKEEILELVCSGKSIAINKITNEPCDCDKVRDCIECTFNGCMGICRKKFAEWCNAEYVEPCPFEKDELVEVSEDGIGWTIRYFSNMCNGMYYAFCGGNKSTETGETCRWNYCRKYGTLGGLIIME